MSVPRPLRIFFRVGLIVVGLVVGVVLMTHRNAETPASADTVLAPREVSARWVPFSKKQGTVKRGALRTPAPEFPEGTVPGEMVLTFASERDYQVFLRRARELKLAGIETVPGLRAVRLGADDLAKLGPGEGGLADFNYVVRPPDMPEKRPAEEGGTAEFGGEALKWLGATAATAGWGEGVTIALLDTGVAPGSPVAARLSGVLDMTGEGPATADGTGHGTAIATLLLGEEGRVKGVAPGSKVLSVRVIGSDGTGDSFALARGIVESVDRGARVLSVSLGSFGDSQIVRDAVAYAQARNAVVVAAVGNESTDTVAYPARYDGVIGVTATDALGRVPSFANRGPEVDIAAPGVGVLTRWDAANGIAFTGTSAAVPFVSGAVAGLMSQNPRASAAEVSSLIAAYGNDAGPPAADPIYGSGLLNFTRLLERNTAGVRSLAVADFYADRSRATATAMPVVVTVQNRGTVPLDSVLIETKAGGVPAQQFIQRLGPGQSGSTTISVPLGRATEISATARSLVTGTSAAATRSVGGEK